MKILVTGKDGQLGYDLEREGQQRGLDIIATNRETLDITDEDAVSRFVEEAKPDAIIHCAAYTAVDKAEDDQAMCFDVNVNGTKHLAEAAKKVGAKFMYISTDYVFDGKGEQAFLESDAPNPVGHYGQTKLDGEVAIQEILENYFIVRISWVFGLNGHNFIKTMLKLAETRDELSVVADQIGSPTYTYDLAKLLLEMIQTDKYGIYHATNEGFTSWHAFATEIFSLAGKQVKVNAITTEEFPTRAVRPKNSRLSKQKLRDNGFTPLPTWQDALKRYIHELEVT